MKKDLNYFETTPQHNIDNIDNELIRWYIRKEEKISFINWLFKLFNEEIKYLSSDQRIVRY